MGLQRTWYYALVYIPIGYFQISREEYSVVNLYPFYKILAKKNFWYFNSWLYKLALISLSDLIIQNDHEIHSKIFFSWNVLISV